MGVCVGKNKAKVGIGDNEKDEPTDEHWELLGHDAGVAAGIGADVGAGSWWWGHPFGSEKPPPAGHACCAGTAALPAYYRDVIRLKMCPSHMDSLGDAAARCPFFGATCYMSHEEVSRLLAEVPDEIVKGHMERKNELGYLQLSGEAFTAGTIGLGNSVEVHRAQRKYAVPLLNRLPGPSGLFQEANEFLQGRMEIKVGADIDAWWARLLWKYMLSRELSDEEVKRFVSFRNNWLISAVVKAGKTSVGHITFTLDDMKRTQEAYRAEIETLLPANIPLQFRHDVAQAVLEAMAFAGGLSLPATIKCAIAALYQDFLPEPVNKYNVKSFIYECTRLFPAVDGFPFWKNGQRRIAYMNAALRDPKVWGENANRFTLKDLSLYEKFHVGFANPAVATQDEDSRYCPGRQMTLDVASAFVLALTKHDAHSGKNLSSLWRPAEPIKPATKPSYFQEFVLERVQGDTLDVYRAVVDGHYSGTGDLRSLTPEKMTIILEWASKDLPHALHKMDHGTRLFYQAARTTWMDLHAIELTLEPPKAWPSKFTNSNSFQLAVGGIRMPSSDEQWSGMAFLERAAFVVLDGLDKTASDDVDESLLIDSPAKRLEAIALAQMAFGGRDGHNTYLPECTDPWSEFESDSAQVFLALFGAGQLFLRRNSEHEPTEYGDLACDCSLVGSLPVRPAFESLGAVALFKRTDDSTPYGYTITGIYWCHGQRIVTPTEGDAWEHAKYAWRCSIGTHVTAVNHLAQTHWIVANALSTSIRTALSPYHPIRRLLHVNIYNTASINSASYKSLYPKDGFLNHMCSLTYDGLKGAFDAALELFEFQTWPQYCDGLDVPEDVKAALPMVADGLAYWKILHEFVMGYVSLYYADDDAVMADPELQCYWNFECAPQYTKGLPALSKGALVNQIAHAIFHVTAYHEFVGSVVEYLVDPAGGFMRVRPGQNMADMEHLIQALSLSASTGSPMPRYMDDWSSLLDLGPEASKNLHSEAVDLFRTMQQGLQNLSAEVKERNKTRPKTCHKFDPEYFECSVNL